MPADFHRHFLRHTGANHVPHAGAAQIVEQFPRHPRQVANRTAEGLSERDKHHVSELTLNIVGDSVLHTRQKSLLVEFGCWLQEYKPPKTRLPGVPSQRDAAGEPSSV